MIAGILLDPEKTILAGPLRTAGKILCVISRYILIGTWITMVKTLSNLALDYPLRRAGDSIEYPPAGTLPFYIGCGEALLGMAFIPVFVLALALSLISAGLGVGRWRPRFLFSVALLILPVIAIGTHDVYAGVQFIRANPRPVPARAPG
jgi:hypothetical protein